MSKHVVIAGAGLVGSLAAIIMAKRGYKVSLFERRPDARKTNIYAGRSINLALSDRGLQGLQRAGITEDIMKVALPMRGRMIHNTDGHVVYQPYGKGGQAINSVSRGGLNCALLDCADTFENITIRFSSRCTDIDLETNTVYFTDDSDNTEFSVTADHVIGADGAYSAIRTKMQKLDRFDYEQKYLPHGYKELTIPAGDNGSFRIEPNALHIWPRGNFMLIALPNMDGSFTCTLFLPFEGERHSFEYLNACSDSELMAYFQEQFADAVPLMPTLISDFRANPVSSLVTVRCSPWHYRDSVVLLGDSAHAIVPFYGQGMNAGFQDCVVFDDILEATGDSWAEALPRFTNEHSKNGHAIADLALLNFIEMRDKVADPRFLLRKKIEQKLADLYPELFKSVYSMVTFSPEVPYSTALAEVARHDAMFDRILALPGVEDNWESASVLTYIKEILTEGDYSYE